MAARKRAAGAGLFITARISSPDPRRARRKSSRTFRSIFVRRVGRNNRYAIFARGVGGVECPATIWLDGIRVGGGSDRCAIGAAVAMTTYCRESGEIDQLVSPPEIAGVEVYSRGMLAPPQFLPPDDPDASRCAVLVFWTKHG